MEITRRLKVSPPTRTIKIGDLVKLVNSDHVGFVVGDALSPGGMQGHMQVMLLLKMESATSDGLRPAGQSVILQAVYARVEKLEYLDCGCQPILLEDLSRWESRVTSLASCYLSALHLTQLDPRITNLESA